jgi:hypothetical protein
LPAPALSVKGYDFWIVFRKELDLGAFNLNEWQLHALILKKNADETSTSDYMKRYNVSKCTASYDFAELQKKILSPSRTKRNRQSIFLPINCR